MASITEFPFVEQIEDEAMALLLEARSVLSRRKAQPDTDTDDTGHLISVHRNFEVTARLSWVVAWVFYQKAVRAGEMTSDEAEVRHPRLNLPRDPTPDEAKNIPEDLQDRLDRSRALYDRALGFQS